MNLTESYSLQKNELLYLKIDQQELSNMKNREREDKKNSFSDLRDNIKWSYICVTGVPEEERELGRKSLKK